MSKTRAYCGTNLKLAAEAANRHLRVADSVAKVIADQRVTAEELILACIRLEPLGPEDLCAIGAAFGIYGNEMKFVAHHLVFERRARIDDRYRLCALDETVVA